MNCKNCQTEVNLNYCPECGQPVSLKRINGHYVINEIVEVLICEKGILYTIRELLTRPGENIKHFLTENRSRLVKPIIFILVTSLLFTLVNHFFHIEEGYVQFDAGTKSSIGIIFNWIQHEYGYANIIMGIFIAIWIKIFFRKYDYNFYEILILLCFVVGIAMLIFTFFALLQGLTKINLMQIAGFLGVTYCTWAIGQFFDKKKPINFVKAFASYILGLITFTLTAILLGTLIDLMIKH